MKIKLDLRFDEPAPEPPRFVCDLCGIERDHWTAIHRGEKLMCWFHRDRGTRLPQDARQAMNWLDVAQLQVISSLIGELKHG